MPFSLSSLFPTGEHPHTQVLEQICTANGYDLWVVVVVACISLVVGMLTFMVLSPVLGLTRSQSKDRSDARGARSRLCPTRKAHRVMDVFLGEGDLFDVLETAPAPLLCAHMPLLLRAIDQTPSWLCTEREELLNTARRRAQDPVVRQSLQLALSVGFVTASTTRELLGSPETKSPWSANKCDAAKWFRGIAEDKSSHTAGHVFRVPKDLQVYHPFFPWVQVQSAKVNKVFKSNAKPLHLTLKGSSVCSSLTAAASVCSKSPDLDVIFKVGDDLRQDVGCLQVVALFNRLWEAASSRFHSSLAGPPRGHTYKCVAVDPFAGCIELVPNTSPLKSISELSPFSDDARRRMVRTAAGTFVVSFLLGVRDRHSDNILVRPDGLVFHIDYGRILGDSLLLDTSKMAVTKGLQRAMGEYWDSFIDMSVAAFSVLREHHALIIEFSVVALGTVCRPEQVAAFLRQSFLLQVSPEEAMVKIRRKLVQAPTSNKTRLKNFVHGLATR